MSNFHLRSHYFQTLWKKTQLLLTSQFKGSEIIAKNELRHSKYYFYSWCLWFYIRWNLLLSSSFIHDSFSTKWVKNKIMIIFEPQILEKAIIWTSVYFRQAVKIHIHFLYFHCWNLLTASAEHAVKGKFQKNVAFYVRKEEEKSILKGPRIILKIKGWNKLLILLSHYLK